MENTGNLHSQEIKIQGLIDRYLKAKTSNNNTNLSDVEHLDEDSLTAFVEGNLTDREAKPVITHLVDCSFCRHITRELVRLDLAFAIEEIPLEAVESEQPSKISEVLSGLMARIFGTNDGVVFAHQEDEKPPEEEEKAKDKES